MGVCLSCHDKPKPIPLVDPPSKRLPNQAQTVKKPSISEDFWTSSTIDMENSAVMSQGSISSISTSNQTDPNNGAGNVAGPGEFVNHGLLLWNQTRQRWVGSKRSDSRPQQIREPKLRKWGLGSLYKKHLNAYYDHFWNATYESLLGSNKPFPQPIPLGEMVDFLVDIWEQDGMYD